MSDVKFRKYLLNAVEEVGETLGPNDDWAPVLLSVGHDETLTVVPIDDEDMARDLPAMTALIVKLRPRIVGRVNMGWASQDPSDPRPIANQESRQEVLVIQVVQPGDQEVWIGSVERHDDRPPEVTGWEKSEAAGGVMVEVIQTAVEHANRMN